MNDIDNKQLFKLMRNSVHQLSSVALRGKEYAHDNGIVISLEHDFLITSINKLEDNSECNIKASDDSGDDFEMMASTCEAIRNLADAYGGDKHFNNCVLMALRSCVAALEGLNK